MERKDIKVIINRYAMASRQEPQFKQDAASVIKSEPEAVDMIIRELGNDQFWRFVRNLDLPDEYARERMQCEIDVLKNSESHSLGAVQSALADLWFRMEPDSFSLRLKTIEERAAFYPEYKKTYDKYREYLKKVDAFFKLKEGEVSGEQVSEILKELIEESKSVTKDEENFEIFDKLCKEAQNGFRSELDSRLEGSRERMFEGIEPEVAFSPSGKEVKVYKMQNQTENQRHFEVLIHSVSNLNMESEEAREQYFERSKNYPYTSYSLFSESLNKQFLKNGVIFGYSTTGDAEMLSCTTRDGQTNQSYLDTGRYILRQQYLPVDEFVAQTDGYNEIVLRQSEQITPSMIISLEYPPSDISILMAEKFNVPIVFIDKSAYPERVDGTTPMEWFKNRAFLASPLPEIREKSGEATTPSSH